MRPACFVLLCAIVCGCGRDEIAHESAGPTSERLAARSEGSGAAADASAADAGAAWTPFSRQNDVPICLFARYADWGNAQLLADAKQKVSLKAGRPLYFGAYVPGCADPACIRRVTLQCWAEVEGRSITLQTRFSGEQQPEQSCTKDCQPATAACETPKLKAGTYTLTHGAQQRTIRIPGLQEPACF